MEKTEYTGKEIELDEDVIVEPIFTSIVPDDPDEAETDSEEAEKMECIAYTTTNSDGKMSEELYIRNIEGIFRVRRMGCMSWENFVNNFKSLDEDYSGLEVTEKMRSYKAGGRQIFSEDRNMVLFLFFYYNLKENPNEAVNLEEFDGIFETGDETVKKLREGSHVFMRERIVKYSNNDTKSMRKKEFEFSDFFKRDLLDNGEECDVKETLSFIRSENINKKEMFYESEEKEKIEKLINVLSCEKFYEVEKKLEEKGMKKGFTCIFAGGPGTGKTETAYQIARITGRDIYKVETAFLQDMWVGETEKKIKEIFDDYRRIKDRSRDVPIFLFNEADGIMVKRMNLTEMSRSVDVMENHVQNILLEELENFEGILIATTNFAVNFDAAFERRFLYKIEFKLPTPENRKKIWRDKLKDVAMEVTDKIAEKFELSGGNMENVVRKYLIEEVMCGEKAGVEALEKFCEEEKNNCFNYEKKIGFNV